MAPAAEKKTCDYCDQEIGANEAKCPKCGVVFEDEDELVSTVGRALSVIEKRKAREKAAKDAEDAANAPPPEVKKKGSALLRGFGRR